MIALPITAGPLNWSALEAVAASIGVVVAAVGVAVALFGALASAGVAYVAWKTSEAAAHTAAEALSMERERDERFRQREIRSVLGRMMPELLSVGYMAREIMIEERQAYPSVDWQSVCDEHRRRLMTDLHVLIALEKDEDETALLTVVTRVVPLELESALETSASSRALWRTMIEWSSGRIEGINAATAFEEHRQELVAELTEELASAMHDR